MFTGAMIGFGLVMLIMWVATISHFGEPKRGWDFSQILGDGFMFVGTGAFIGWLIEGFL